MQFLTIVAAFAASALAAPEACAPGTYRCDADGTSIDVCDAQSNWLVAGPCPGDTVCEYLPQNGFDLPFCVNPTTAEKRNTHPPCTPATYTCAHNPTTGAPGIQVCDTQHVWEYVGDCPGKSHCEYFPSNIPYCVDN